MEIDPTEGGWPQFLQRERGEGRENEPRPEGAPGSQALEEKLPPVLCTPSGALFPFPAKPFTRLGTRRSWGHPHGDEREQDPGPPSGGFLQVQLLGPRARIILGTLKHCLTTLWKSQPTLPPAIRQVTHIVS